MRIVVAVKAVSRTREPLDDHLDVAACPPGHLIADKLRLFGQGGFPDCGAELAQLGPRLRRARRILPSMRERFDGRQVSRTCSSR